MQKNITALKKCLVFIAFIPIFICLFSLPSNLQRSGDLSSLLVPKAYAALGDSCTVSYTFSNPSPLENSGNINLLIKDVSHSGPNTYAYTKYTINGANPTDPTLDQAALKNGIIQWNVTVPTNIGGNIYPGQNILNFYEDYNVNPATLCNVSSNNAASYYSPGSTGSYYFLYNSMNININGSPCIQGSSDNGSSINISWTNNSAYAQKILVFINPNDYNPADAYSKDVTQISKPNQPVNTNFSGMTQGGSTLTFYPNKTYYVVLLLNDGNHQIENFESSFTVNETPSAPTISSPSGIITPGTYPISWTSTSGSNTYALRIWDYTQNASWDGSCPPDQANNVCTNNTSSPYTYNFQAGHNYAIWVHGVSNVCGFSPASTIDYVWTLVSSPSMPQIDTACLPASGDDGSSINVSWTNNATAVTRIDVSSNPGFQNPIWSKAVISQNNQPVTINLAGLSGSPTFYPNNKYYVRTYNGFVSPNAKFTLQTSLPGPSNLSPSGNINPGDYTSVGWAPVNGASGYSLKIWDKTQNASLDGSCPSDQGGNICDSNASSPYPYSFKPGHIYQISVQTISTTCGLCGTSTSNVTVSLSPSKPVINTVACISSGDNGSGINIAWTNGSIPSTAVQISTDSSFSAPYQKSVTGLPNQSSGTDGTGFYSTVTLSTLSYNPGITYYVRLFNGSYSSSASFVLGGIPSSPSTLTPSSGQNPVGNTSITWGAVIGASAYEVSVWDKTVNPGLSNPICGVNTFGLSCQTIPAASTTTTYSFVPGHTYQIAVQTISSSCGSVSTPPIESTFVTTSGGYLCNKVQNQNNASQTIGYYCSSSPGSCTYGVDANCYEYLDLPAGDQGNAGIIAKTCDMNCRPSCSSLVKGWGQFSKLQIDGGIVAGGTEFQRDLFQGDNSCLASEQIVYDSRYMSESAFINLIGQYLQNYHELGF